MFRKVTSSVCAFAMAASLSAVAAPAMAQGSPFQPEFNSSQEYRILNRRDAQRDVQRYDRRDARQFDRRDGRGFYQREGRGWYNGHRGYREPRRGYREHSGWWFPPAAFALGAIVGGTIASQPAPRQPTYSYGRAHVDWCYDRYRSYRPADNTFQPYNGPRRQCMSPYS